MIHSKRPQITEWDPWVTAICESAPHNSSINGQGSSNSACTFKGLIAVQGYALVALTTCGGVYFTNWALNFLNYTTRVVAKSCKVLPVMAFRVLIQRKPHSLWEYLAALLLATGISAFLLGDKQTYPNFNATGLFLICLGVVGEPGQSSQMRMKLHSCYSWDVYVNVTVLPEWLVLAMMLTVWAMFGNAQCSRLTKQINRLLSMPILRFIVNVAAQ